jgi:drug/metabolite transporter (DMT)-like permease
MECSSIVFFGAGHKICFVFSLSGVIFLSVIAILLGQNSIYVQISGEYSNKKPALTGGIGGAIAMYVCCMILSGYLWYRALTAKEIRDDDMRLLE